jgi:hypothetical protein
MLRGLGGMQVTLRIADPSAGDTNSQLGLSAPTAAEVQIYPAVVRVITPAADGKRRIQATLSAKAVHPVAEQYGVEDVASWLLTAQALFYRGKLMRIETVISDRFGTADYLYHIMATE